MAGEASFVGDDFLAGEKLEWWCCEGAEVSVDFFCPKMERGPLEGRDRVSVSLLVAGALRDLLVR